MRRSRYPSAVGFVADRVSGQVDLLKRFCREQCWKWAGLVASRDLPQAMQHDFGPVVLRVTDGRLVTVETVIVPSYSAIRHVPLQNGMEWLRTLARAHVAVVSATDDFTADEVAWLLGNRASEEMLIAA